MVLFVRIEGTFTRVGFVRTPGPFHLPAQTDPTTTFFTPPGVVEKNECDGYRNVHIEVENFETEYSFSSRFMNIYMTRTLYDAYDHMMHMNAYV